MTQAPRYFSFEGVGFLSAHFERHVFTPHAHDEYSIGVVCSGVLVVDRAGRRFAAARHAISAVNPGEIHTGRPGCDGGWDYRNFFVPTEALERFCPETGSGLPDFRDPVIGDARAASALLEAHDLAANERVSILEKETALALSLGLLFSRHADGVRPSTKALSSRPSTLRCRDYLEEHFADDVRLEQLASLAGLSPYHFLRTFAKDTGFTPHAYQIQVRIRHAVRRLKDGAPAAEVAIESGFFDQSHLTKALKRTWGLTPPLLQSA